MINMLGYALDGAWYCHSLNASVREREGEL
jgi:hypothetical protein